MRFADSSLAIVTPLWLGATREDPAQDQLRMVIIGLVALAGVLLIAQVVFWRTTSPRRRARPDRPVAVAELGSIDQDRPLTSEGVGATPAATSVSVPVAVTVSPAEGESTAEPAAIVKIPLADGEAPWPPDRVGHRGSSRAPRPPDPPGSLFARLSAVVDLDLTPQGARSDVSIADRPPSEVVEITDVDRPADSLQ